MRAAMHYHYSITSQTRSQNSWQLIKGKFAPTELDIWVDVCRPIIALRDGVEAAYYESADKSGYWADHSRLTLTEIIMAEVMSFIGHTGRSAGSYVSFHAGMIRRARQVECLPSVFQKKEGLRKMLANIGSLVMTAAAGRDATMLLEAVGVAHIRTPFFQTNSASGTELALFDKDLEEARSKARLHEDYGDNEDGNFRRNGKKTGSWTDSSWSDYEQPGKKPRLTYAGVKLEIFTVYLTRHGFIFGCKFLVIVTTPTVPQDECVGCFSYSTSEERRAEWCCKGGCSGHPRPAGLSEDKFRVINVYASDNSDADAKLSKEVLDTQDAWIHWAGPKNFSVMGGKGGRSWDKLATESNPSQGGNRGSFHGGGKGKGKGSDPGKGNGGKGRGKGKGKGGKGKGGKASNFGRQR